MSILKKDYRYNLKYNEFAGLNYMVLCVLSVSLCCWLFGSVGLEVGCRSHFFLR